MDFKYKYKELFNKVVEQARAKGIITDRLQIIDSIQIEARVDLFRLKEEGRQLPFMDIKNMRA